MKTKNQKEKHNSPDIAVYESFAHCIGATGIPRATLKFAKANGCPAFRGARVVLGPLLRWLFKQDELDANINWSDELRKAQTLRERLKLAKDKNQLADKSEIQFGLNRIISKFFDALDRLAKIEIPPAAVGLEAMGVSKLLVEKFERLKVEMREGFQRMAEAEKTKTED